MSVSLGVSLDSGTTIGTLRLLAAAADPNALRMRGGTVLGTLDLQPPAMPEQSILCIRRLHDPLPGGLDLRSTAAPRPVEWEAAMRGAMAEALRRAVRPALGAVPASAAAVLFADRAELLACAARDALCGTLALNWWWTHLLGGERSLAAVVREWTRAPAYVPAAVELLTAQREIAAFALTLARSDAVRLLEAVLRAHALPAPAFHLVEALTATSAPLAPRQAQPYDMPPPESRPRTDLFTPPPWRAIVADLAPVLTALPIEQQTFVAVALVLRRAPALVRNERFTREAVAWIESGRRGERSRGVPAAPLPAASTVAEPPRVADLRGESNEAAKAEPAPRATEPRQPARRLDPRKPERAVSLAAPQSAEPPAEPLLAAAPGPASPEPRQTHPPIVDDPPAPDAAPAPEILERHADLEAAEPPRPVDFEIAIDSGFAGVFFLLNVGIALGLYSDFTSPVQCGIDLNIWDFLALTGSALARSAGDFESDPIWPLLATLANRGDGEPPGADFTPPPPWEGGLPGPLAAWLAATVESIRERLALAGIAAPSGVVRRYGRVTTTPAHLDVSFSLAAHPIEIRIAGLDRNPGWIPAAGRHVAFHFD
jgi:hypothetical protein